MQETPIHQLHAALERTVAAMGLEWVSLRPYSFAGNALALVGTRPELSGPEALTTKEQVAVIDAAPDMPVRFEEIPRAQAREQAVAAGYPADLVEALFDRERGFRPQLVTGAVEAITGRAPRSFRHWALDHAEAFR